MNKKDNSVFPVARQAFGDNCETTATSLYAIRTETSFHERRGACVECGKGFIDGGTAYCAVVFEPDGGYSLSKPMCTECAGY